MPDYIDLALKGIIEDLFDHFMLYFLPEIFAGMDHSVPPEFLDKELETLFPDSEPHGRIADKLIKVRLTTGDDFFILIHIEFQGYEDSAFAGRMFTYYYRIFDRYRLPVEALAIFTGRRVTDVGAYNYDGLTTRLDYRYKTFHINNLTEQTLLAGTNPFSLVMLALKKLDAGKKTPMRLFELKKEMINCIFDYEIKQFDLHTVDRLILFLDAVIKLPDELKTECIKYIDDKKGVKNMAGLMIELTDTYEYAYGKGVREGEQKGKMEGFLEGKLEDARKMLKKHIPISDILEITGLSIEDISKLQ